jgi:hypothetical protein
LDIARLEVEFLELTREANECGFVVREEERTDSGTGFNLFFPTLDFQKLAKTHMVSILKDICAGVRRASLVEVRLVQDWFLLCIATMLLTMLYSPCAEAVIRMSVCCL